MQGHVDARESGTDHQDALEPARTESRERTRRPGIQHDFAVGSRSQHRRERTLQRLGHAPVGTSGRQDNGVGRQGTAVAQLHLRAFAGHQADDLGRLDAHVDAHELFLQVAAIGKTRCEPEGRGDGVFVQPAAEVVGIVWPCGHATGGNVQQVDGIAGAVRHAGTGAAGRVDQRDLGVRCTPA